MGDTARPCLPQVTGFPPLSFLPDFTVTGLELALQSAGPWFATFGTSSQAQEGLLTDDAFLQGEKGPVTVLSSLTKEPADAPPLP